MIYTSFLHWLISQCAGTVLWHSTKRDLVELVSVVAQQGVLKDRRGLPLSQNKLAALAFTACGMKPPKHVSSIVWRIRNRLALMPPLIERIRPQDYPDFHGYDDHQSSQSYNGYQGYTNN